MPPENESSSNRQRQELELARQVRPQSERNNRDPPLFHASSSNQASPRNGFRRNLGGSHGSLSFDELACSPAAPWRRRNESAEQVFVRSLQYDRSQTASLRSLPQPSYPSLDLVNDVENESGSAAAAAGECERKEEEETKEEIEGNCYETDFSAPPTSVAAAHAPMAEAAVATVARLPSTTEEDDDDMLAMKRSASGGFSSSPRHIGSAAAPTPQDGETEQEYYMRTSGYWRQVALQSYSGQAASWQMLQVEGRRRSSASFYAQQRNEQEATVVTITDRQFSSELAEATAELVGQNFASAAVVHAPLDDNHQSSSQSRRQQPRTTFASAQEATQVTDNIVQPPGLTQDAVQAELIGDDFSQHANAQHASAASSLQPTTAYAATDDGEDTATEATVIDSAPLMAANQAEEVPTWKCADEAQVLEQQEATTDQLFEDSKPPARGRDAGDGAESAESAENGFAIADQEAEVVGIQEDVHPSEFQGEAEAELVGTDGSGFVGIAVTSARDDNETSFASVRSEAVHVNHATMLPPGEAEFLPDGGHGMSDQSAEVVGIQEDVHPSQFEEDDAEAELVGTNSAVAVGFAVSQMSPPTNGALPAALDEQRAQVVGIQEDVHPSEFEEGDAQAQLIGAHGAVAVGLTVHDESQAQIVSIQEDVHPAEFEDGDAEALLVGTNETTAYASVADVEAPQVAVQAEATANVLPSGEAQVVDIQDEVHPLQFQDDDAEAELVGTNAAIYSVAVSSAPDPATQIQPARTQLHTQEPSLNTIGDQAEVLGIQDEVHPMEFEEDHAEAELLGPDASIYGVAVAALAEHGGEVVAATEAAHAIEASEVHATLVNDSLAFSEQRAVAPWMRTPSFGGAQPPPAMALPANSEAPAAAGKRSASNSTPIALPPEAATLPVSFESAEEITSPPGKGLGSNEGESLPPTAVTLPVSFESPPAAAATAGCSIAAVAATPTDCRTRNNHAASDNGQPISVARRPVDEDQAGHWAGSLSSASAGRASEGHGDDAAVPDWLRNADQQNDAKPSATPPPRPNWQGFGVTGPEGSATTVNSSERSQTSTNSFASPINIHTISNNIARGTSNVCEALFGDTKPPFMRARNRSSADQAMDSVLSRTLLPWSVICRPTDNMWVATLQTNQKALESEHSRVEASKSLRAFSLPSERQAVCLARAWTPPRMLPFADNPLCHICSSRFAVFRRACHCRNCGVCICHECAVQWPSKMLPETYNRKRESHVNICKGCDWLCNEFRLALLEGNFDKAVAFHSTNNINVNSPFANIKGEVFYPVHCAVLGGNLQLLRWLVDDNCCPIKSVRVSGRTRDGAGRYTPIVTSTGRSLLGIAMECRHVSIVRYLVVDKNISLASEKDVTTPMLLENLDAVLRLLPAEEPSPSLFRDRADVPPFGAAEAPVSEELGEITPMVPQQNSFNETDTERSLAQEARDLGVVKDNTPTPDNQDEDECIICCDNTIDSVANPCGHQIMCMKCAENVSRCPVCNSECTFIRVYRK